MNRLLLPLFAASTLLLAACGSGDSAATPAPTPTPALSEAWRGPLNVSHQGVSVDVVIDKPAGNAFDVLLVYHGTVMRDDLVMQAANDTLDAFRALIDDPSIMVISVAYPEQNLLIGDNLVHAEAALLWVRNQAASQLGLQLRHIFLGGHSQGGYLVTRLNTLHPTRGVIANAPGPLDLVLRCRLEEDGTIPAGEHCARMRNAYGTTAANPSAYLARSLRSFTTGYQSDILFVQGLDDSRLVQLEAWPGFRQQIEACTNCKGTEFLELPGLGHTALFNSTQARDTFRAFLNARR
jgi:acetyl esterase/lipase